MVLYHQSSFVGPEEIRMAEAEYLESLDWLARDNGNYGTLTNLDETARFGRL